MTLESSSGKKLNLENRFTVLNYSQKMKRAFQGAGLCFALALASVFIPVFHFVLVPLFLILSIIMGFIKFAQNQCVDLSDLKCPDCSETLQEKKVYFKAGSIRIHCVGCRAQHRVI